jgi:hypothetical protein
VSHLINMLANLAWIAMCFTSMAIDFRERLPERLVDGCRKVFFNVRPFAPLLIVVLHVTYSSGAWRWFLDGLNVFVWLVMRLKKDDDDRWKKRGKKLAEKVSQQGSRLVVVPVGGQR